MVLWNFLRLDEEWRLTAPAFENFYEFRQFENWSLWNSFGPSLAISFFQLLFCLEGKKSVTTHVALWGKRHHLCTVWRNFRWANTNISLSSKRELSPSKLKSYLSVALYLIPFTFTAAQLVNQLILISRFERDITSVIPKPEWAHKRTNLILSFSRQLTKHSVTSGNAP